MNKNKINRQIDFELKIKDHLWNAMMLTLAGTIGLTLSGFSLYKAILIIVGIILLTIFINAYFRKDDKVKKLIDKLEI